MSRIRSRHPRAALALLLAGLLAIVSVACQSGLRAQRQKRPTPLPAGVDPNELADAGHVADADDPLGPLNSAEISKAYLQRRAEAALERRAREQKLSQTLGRPYRQREYNILVLSGGGVFGAYPAGILCGWTAANKPPEQGGRPVFDVVTGVSTGAFIAPLAFLGPEYDPILQKFYTTVRNRDIFRIRRSVRSFFAESLADNTPLRHRLEEVINEDVIRRIGEEHRKGRRLYMGTTNLDTRRLVVWDIGAIAAKGGPGARPLVLKVMLASGAIPGLFPSVRFDVTIDGQPYEEMHVDGGVSRAMFFRPPHFPPGEPEAVGPTSLAGSNLFALVAGKAYPDPEGVRARTVAVVGAAVSNLLYVAARGDLYRFYTYSMLSGMDFFTAAIPPDLEVTSSSTNFDPKETTKLFNEGYRLAQAGAYTLAPKENPKATGPGDRTYGYPDGTPILFKEPGPAWRNTPPGVDSGERGRNRAGLELVIKKNGRPSHPQGTDQHPGGVPPVVK